MFFARFISGFFDFRGSARIFYGNLVPKLTRANKSERALKTLSSLPKGTLRQDSQIRDNFNFKTHDSLV